MGALRNNRCRAPTAIFFLVTSGTSLTDVIKKSFYFSSRDRQRYLRWIFEAKKRYGLSVLDYMITSNHVHLLLKDTGPNVIARSMQLITGRSGQEYNERKARHGAFWEDRYHATAIETDAHLQRCIVYIDLNMVRAGVVKNPLSWVYSGFYEVQQSPKRYRLIDLPTLLALCGFSKQVDFQQARRQWVEQALQGAFAMRDARGRKRLRLAAKRSSRRLKESWEAKRCIANGSRWMERMRYENLVKLTTAILPSKMTR